MSEPVAEMEAQKMKLWSIMFILLLATVVLMACAIPIDGDCSFNHLKYDVQCPQR
jgi:hypothetical protein